jgi:uncharacterized OB-fold protein
VEVPDKGQVYTYTVLTRSLEDEPLDEPQVLALIELEGVHGGLVHKLGAVQLDEVEVGLEVEAVFKPEQERVGSILDIQYFRPV